jgi:hypothetical protein
MKPRGRELLWGARDEMARPKRDWTQARQKVEDEGRCRACARGRHELAGHGLRLEAAHLAGRTYDEEVVNPDDVLPLCGPATQFDTCHARLDQRNGLDLLPFLTREEQARMVLHLGMVVAFEKATGGTRK